MLVVSVLLASLLVPPSLAHAGDVRTHDQTTHRAHSTQSVDLALDKTASRERVRVGEPLVYVLTVTNQGETTAGSFGLRDVLPDGAELRSVDSSDGVFCRESDGTVTCSVEFLEPGASVEVRLAVAFAREGPVTNEAQLLSDEDTTPENNEDAVTTRVGDGPDLTVDKSSPINGVVGEPFTYTIFVVNEGTETATNVTVTDDLPDPLDGSVVNVTADRGDCRVSNGTVDCTVPRIGPNETGVEVTITVVPEAAGTLNNTVTVGLNETDLDPENNDDSAETTIERGTADVGVKKTGPESVEVGETFNYTITVTNNGPDEAINVTVFDELPFDVELLGTDNPDGTCEENERRTEITCLVSDLQPGESIEITVTVRAQSPDSQARNRVRREAGVDEDPNPENDENTATTEITRREVDLVTGKRAPTERVGVGETFNYTVAVVNRGDDTAKNVRVTENLPSGVKVNSVTVIGTEPPARGVDGECSVTRDIPPVVTCTVPELEPDERFFLNISVTVVTEGTLRNTVVASVTEDDEETDTDLGSNADTVTTTARREADLAVNKTGPEEATVGQRINYTITVTNDGPSNATNVSVDDWLVTAFGRIDRVSTSEGECTVTFFGALTGIDCRISDLGPDETVTINVTVVAQARGFSINGVTVQANETDPSLFDGANADRVPTTILGENETDISLDKSAPSEVTAGQTFNITITVRNNGPNEAENVTVVDDFSRDKVRIEGITAEEGTCRFSPSPMSVASCNISEIPPGETVTINITVTAKDVFEAFDVARVSFEGEDADPGPVPSLPDTQMAKEVQVEPHEADISVDKTAPEEVRVGQTFNYTITVTNDGPDDATGVRVTEDLPLGVRVQGVSASAGECSVTRDIPQILTCDISEIEPGERGEPVTINVTVEVVSAGVLRNTVTAHMTDEFREDPDLTSPDSPDPPDSGDRDNTDVTRTTAKSAEIDLGVDKQTPEEGVVGEPMNITITVTNDGPSTATNVTVGEDISDTVDIRDIEISEGDCEIVEKSVRRVTNRKIDCTIAELAPGENVTITIRVVPQVAGTHPNFVEVDAPEEDTDDENNRESTPTEVLDEAREGEADVSIDKTAPERVAPGERVNYTITVTNAGPDNATNVTVIDALPDGITAVNVSSREADCSAYGNISIACEIRVIEPGETVTINVTATATGEGTLRNQASVTVEEQNEPDTGDNSVEARTAVSSRSGGATVSLRPADASVELNGSTTLDVVLAGVGNGVSAYALNVTVGDTSTAEITAVSDATGGTTSTDVAPDGSTASIAVVGAGETGPGPITLASVVVQGTAVGETTLTLASNGIGDADSDPYTLAAVEGATLGVREDTGPPSVCPGGSTPTDPDRDGTYEDANGDGSFDIFDVQCLLDTFGSSEVQNNAAAFDFTGEGDVDIFDVQAALDEV